MSRDYNYPPMTYEQLRESHDEWKKLSIENYLGWNADKERAEKAEEREQILKKLIEKIYLGVFVTPQDRRKEIDQIYSGLYPDKEEEAK